MASKASESTMRNRRRQIIEEQVARARDVGRSIIAQSASRPFTSRRDGFAKMLAEGREEFVNQILSARSISEHEYDQNRTYVFHGDVSAFTESEEYAYHTRRKFALGADDSLTRGHVLLAASMPDVSSVIDRTAVFLYDGSWKGFRRGTPPRHTDALLFLFGPIKALLHISDRIRVDLQRVCKPRIKNVSAGYMEFMKKFATAFALSFTTVVAVCKPATEIPSLDRVYTVDEFDRDFALRQHVLAACNSNPGQLRNDPNCVNSLTSHLGNGEDEDRQYQARRIAAAQDIGVVMGTVALCFTGWR